MTALVLQERSRRVFGTVLARTPSWQETETKDPAVLAHSRQAYEYVSLASGTGVTLEGANRRVELAVGGWNSAATRLQCGEGDISSMGHA